MEANEDYLTEIRYIGLRIAYFQKLRGLTQEKLAEKVLSTSITFRTLRAVRRRKLFPCRC